MSAPAEIAPLAEVIALLGLGSALTDADRALLTMLKGAAENDMRSFCEWEITQATYTEFLPNRPVTGDQVEVLDFSNNQLSQRIARSDGEVLQLSRIYVRSITSIYEDPAAQAGFGTSDFAATTLLTQGRDYYPDLDESGLCISGQVYRYGRSWSARPRTIKATYVAGFTAAELDTTYSNLKLIAVEETIGRFKYAKSRFGADSTGVGRVKSERLGEYAVAYDTKGHTASLGTLSEDTMANLEAYMMVNL